MSQCVPTWGFGDSAVVAAAAGRLSLRSPATSAATDIPISICERVQEKLSPAGEEQDLSNYGVLVKRRRLDYEVAELTWENGQLALHGLGPPRAPPKAPPSGSASPWDKPRAGGTLESIVNQATRLPNSKPCLDDELVPWFDHHRGSGAPACGSGAPAGGSATVTMDALVPCSNDRSDREQSTRVMDTVPGIGVGCLTRVGSSTGPLAVASQREEEALVGVKRARVAARGPPAEWSVSGSTTFGRDSQRVTADTYEMDVGTGYTSTSVGGSLENTSSGKPYTKTTTGDDHDSVCHSRPQMEVGDEEEDKKKVSGKSSVSTKRSRAAAIHNQSERKRRDKINQRMKTLQKLVPNSSKTDKASMLDEVIEYLKQLQAQVNMMSRLNMPSMILPMAIQQQLQMSMMASPMGLGMGMGMGFGVMDINSMNRAATAATAPNMMANPFMAMAPPSWDGSSNDPRPQPPMMPDPMTAFLACPSQPMTMDAYSRMAALYQQMQQQLPQPSNPKS